MIPKSDESEVGVANQVRPNQFRKSSFVVKGARGRRRSSIKPKNVCSIDGVLEPFILCNEDYQALMGVMLEKFKEGLAKDSNFTASVKMIPTYVRDIPNGSEKGQFIALDLGGTNFRILLVTLNGPNTETESRSYLIPQQIMLGHGHKLFDLIATYIFNFMEELQLLTKEVPLGFTFSFPVDQEGLNKATLTQWTKGFQCEGVVGQNIVSLLHDALERKGLENVECIAVVNDTVGALMSAAQEDNYCAVGLILGTGTNAAYIEQLDNVELWDGDNDHPRQVLINTEWGALGDDGALEFVRTEHDEKVDKYSLNSGKQTYEKMISGMYLGEVVRLVLEKLRKGGHLFQANGGKASEEMSVRGRFYTKYVSEIESDSETDNYKNARQVFDDLGIPRVSEEDCRLAKLVCEVVSKRAAYLAATGLACLLNKMERPNVTIGVDGSLYRFHPNFAGYMMEKLRDLVNPGIEFRMILSNDGSGKGAAIVTAVAHKLRLEKEARRLT